MIPQIIYLILLGIAICDAIHKHGKPKTGNYDATPIFIGILVQFIIMWWGGFFNPMFK